MFQQRIQRLQENSSLESQKQERAEFRRTKNAEKCRQKVAQHEQCIRRRKAREATEAQRLFTKIQQKVRQHISFY